MVEVLSGGFGKITGIGTRNPDNRIAPKVCQTRRVEVALTQERSNSAINLEITVPIQRSERGSRRVTALNLNGSQARALYETLSRFFEQEKA